MSIIINSILGKENLKLVGGKVLSYQPGTGAATGKVVNITLEDNIKVSFWDNEARNLCSRVKKANVKVGSFISILAVFKDGDMSKGVALNFKYNGKWDFKEDTSSIKPTKSGLITDINDSAGKYMATLDNGNIIVFENFEKGFHFADKFSAKKVKIGDNLAVEYQNGKMTNFAINGKWEIVHSISAIIGNVSFIDELSSDKIRLNISVYDHKDKTTGQNVYKSIYAFFDNEKNAKMLNSIKTKVKQKSPIAVIGRESDKKDIYTGYYFINL